MKVKAASPEQWDLLRRLEMVGYPVDVDGIASPENPFCVIQTSLGKVKNLYVFPDCVGIVLPVRIVASTTVTICGFHLRASWLTGPVS